MKQGLVFFSIFLLFFSAQAQVEDSAFYSAGLRLGLGYNVVDYEQKISDTGTNFTTTAQDISYLHLSFGSQWNQNLWLVLYGSVGSITYDATPSGPSDKHTAMTADVNAEARFTFGDHQERESWVPTYIIGLNGNYMNLVRVPRSLTASYEYDQVPIVSPVIGVTTTLWGERSAWRNTVRLAVPVLSDSDLQVRSGYNFMALTSYTFALGEHANLGIEGMLSYMKLKLTEVSPVTSLDVDHDITAFSVGPRVFLTLYW